jgi:hypothetical protein
MLKIAAVGLVLSCGPIIIGFDVTAAQDIAGVEDCTKTTGLDKRTGCLQSNVNFLQQLVIKNALDARQRLNAAASEVAALKNEIVALKGAVTTLQANVEQLQAARKAAGDKKPEPKKPEAK